MNINGNIIYAEYGINGNSINVIEEVIQNFLKNNIIHIPIKCKFNVYFGDPIRFTRKRLLLTVNGEKYIIPEQNGKPVDITLKVPEKNTVTDQNKISNIPERKIVGDVMIKYVNELKNKHKGQDIYIICSGKSCDFIDPLFFRNKITIGVNQVYRKFKTTYLVRKEGNYLKKVLNESHPSTIHCVTEGDCGGNDKKNVTAYINDKSIHDKKNIFFIKHKKNPHSVQIPDNDNQLIVSYSTSTTAVHLAAHLGAANILLVGHDCGAINGQTNFDGYYDGIKCIPGKGYNNWLSQVSNDINIFKKWIKEKYDCNVYSINPFTNFRLDGNKFT